MRIFLIVIMLVFGLGDTDGACEGFPGSGNVETLISIFSEGLADKSYEIVLVRKVSELDAVKLMGVDKIDYLKFKEQLKQGMAIQFFEVIYSITGWSKLIAYPTFAKRGTLLPQTGAPVFFPENLSEWLMVVVRIDEKQMGAEPFEVVNLPDVANGVISAGNKNHLNLDVKKFISDLKKIYAEKASLDLGMVSQMETGLGKKVIKHLIKRSIK